MKPVARRGLFAGILGLIVVVSLEILLSILAFASPSVDRLLGSPWVEPAIPDARLRHRPNPDFPGHDARGFRNPEALDRAEIVALGDSQTYGTGVPPEAAWPRRLAAATSRTVYNFAYGGYGPAHALLLWDEAMALEPRIVVEAFYLGNDLYDCFDLVYNLEQLPALASRDSAIREQVESAERSQPLAERVVALFEGTTSAAAPAAPAAASSSAAEGGSRLRELVSRSKSFGLLRRARFEIDDRMNPKSVFAHERWESVRARAEGHPELLQLFDDGRLRTAFTSEYRNAALDLGDPRIAEGLEIALGAIRELDARARARGIRLIVLVIPTKEAVFADRWPQADASFLRLAASEEQVMSIVRRRLAEAGIELIEARNALRASLSAGRNPYQETPDGHPTAVGHQVLSDAVVARLGD